MKRYSEGQPSIAGFEHKPSAALKQVRPMIHSEGISATPRLDRPRAVGKAYGATFAKGGAAKHWIQGAVKHPGAFTRSADEAGKSVHEYAEEHKGSSGTLGKRARLALTFEGMRKR